MSFSAQTIGVTGVIFGPDYRGNRCHIQVRTDQVVQPSKYVQAVSLLNFAFACRQKPGDQPEKLWAGLSLRPSVEVGLRHDGGDAETGAGMDVGGGLVMADASTGLAIDLRVRTRYNSNQTLTEFVDIGLRSYISEPDRGRSMKSANAANRCGKLEFGNVYRGLTFARPRPRQRGGSRRGPVRW